MGKAGGSSASSLQVGCGRSGVRGLKGILIGAERPGLGVFLTPVAKFVFGDRLLSGCEGGVGVDFGDDTLTDSQIPAVNNLNMGQLQEEFKVLRRLFQE
jgi:hypothetical protein